MYDKSKVKRFHEYTLEDYNRSLTIEEAVEVKSVEKTDGSFTQIGIRPLIDEDIFIDPSFSEYLPGSGRLVAMGEMDFLIKSILEKKEIKRIGVKGDIKEFSNNLQSGDAHILLSTKFYVEFFTKLMHRIDYKPGYPRLDHNHRIISVSERILGNKIIILNKGAILWEKKVFKNNITNKEEKIDIQIGKHRNDGKIDVVIRSVNKIKNIDSELIKIFEFEESMQ